jgi:hypothetical protein
MVNLYWFFVVHNSPRVLVGSLKMNTTLEYSTRVVQEGDRRCKKSTLNDLAYLTPLRIPLMNPVYIYKNKPTLKWTIKRRLVLYSSLNLIAIPRSCTFNPYLSVTNAVSCSS